MAKTHRIDTSAIRDLTARLELERSSLLCVQLANALGYQIIGLPGSGFIQLAHPRFRSRRKYWSIDSLITALVRDARRLVGR